MKLLGIDISEHQGTIDWNRVKSQGISYAIIRVGYGDNYASQDDKYYKRNLDECTRLGIPFGVYIYSYATSSAQANSEADHVLRLIKGYKLDYPVYYDMEDAGQGSLSSSTLANLASIFCEKIKSNGYMVGVYANLYWWNSKLTSSVFDKYEKWVAQYKSVSQSDYGKAHGIWQFSSSGRVSGIVGNVDMNYCYVDYPSLINPQYDLDKIVVYYGDIDSMSALMVGQRNRCPVMKLSDYSSSGLRVREVIQIGGKAEDTGRFETFKNAANII